MKMLSLTQPVNWVQQTVYAWFFRVKTTALKVVIVLGILIILLWLSTFFYGTFYYVYMPPLSHTKPVHLQFRSDCDMRESLCSFPSANVTFGKIGDPQMLMPGQPYKVHVEIEMPESEVNQNLGMFMVIINFYSKDGEVVKSSHRSVMLRYRSLLLRKLRTFCYAPLMLLDTMEEKQLQRVELFDRYLDDAYKPATWEALTLRCQSKHMPHYIGSAGVH
ncbi:PREDICTED: seipin-like [Priapulus caudatus]|uniref:Seipin n=1 Tax=Priapulus caudatus TaxID=37621 RepID=A0ABM1DVK3_PRICU|nr:PREDICTED: seipin-like [Priapulus caudatus]